MHRFFKTNKYVKPPCTFSLAVPNWMPCCHVWWDGYNSHKYLMWPSRLEFLPEIFSFTRCVVWHLRHFLSLASHMSFLKNLKGPPLFLRFQLTFFISNILGGGYKVIWGTWWYSLLDLVCRLSPDILDGLLSCIQVTVSIWMLLSGGVLVGLF